MDVVRLTKLRLVLRRCETIWRVVGLVLATLLPDQVAYGAALTTLHYFGANATGGQPHAALIQGIDGNYYGTTSEGGLYDEGAVFIFNPSGGVTLLYSFTGGSGGANPYASVVQGGDGSVYGTTLGGGYDTVTNMFGSGTVFKISPTGVMTTLYSFLGGADGVNPTGSLALGTDGSLYGVTMYGGTHSYGNVFKITSSGDFTNLWSFTGGVDGKEPGAGVVPGGDGNFYGTTGAGGSNGFGAVFEIDSAGALAVIYSFTNGLDGAGPICPLLLGTDSNLYGTTTGGGSNSHGTFFKITTSGALTPLHSFLGTAYDSGPESGLVQGSDGSFYGTTQGGGSGGAGTAFRITPSGALTSLYSFTNGLDGGGAEGGLVQGAETNFYARRSWAARTVMERFSSQLLPEY